MHVTCTLCMRRVGLVSASSGRLPTASGSGSHRHHLQTAVVQSSATIRPPARSYFTLQFVCVAVTCCAVSLQLANKTSAPDMCLERPFRIDGIRGSRLASLHVHTRRAKQRRRCCCHYCRHARGQQQQEQLQQAPRAGEPSAAQAAGAGSSNRRGLRRPASSLTSTGCSCGEGSPSPGRWTSWSMWAACSHIPTQRAG